MAQDIIGGAASVTISGVPYNLVKSSYCPTNIARTTKSGQGGVFGIHKMPQPPYITLTVTDAKGLSVGFFNTMENESIVLSLDSGKTVLGVNMWCVESQVVDTDEGQFDLKFEGKLGSVVET